jgi:hypothetical protein
MMEPQQVLRIMVLPTKLGHTPSFPEGLFLEVPIGGLILPKVLKTLT